MNLSLESLNLVHGGANDQDYADAGSYDASSYAADPGDSGTGTGTTDDTSYDHIDDGMPNDDASSSADHDAVSPMSDDTSSMLGDHDLDAGHTEASENGSTQHDVTDPSSFDNHANALGEHSADSAAAHDPHTDANAHSNEWGNLSNALHHDGANNEQEHGAKDGNVQLAGIGDWCKGAVVAIGVACGASGHGTRPVPEPVRPPVISVPIRRG